MGTEPRVESGLLYGDLLDDGCRRIIVLIIGGAGTKAWRTCTSVPEWVASDGFVSLFFTLFLTFPY